MKRRDPMRIAFAVIIGYLVMAAIVIGTSFGIVFGLGEGYQFREGTLDPAPAVLICMLATACAAGLLGGLLTAIIARARWRAARSWLIGVVLVLGALSAAGDWMRARSLAEKAYSTEQIAGMSLPEKLEAATKPMWFSLIVPLIGAGSSALG